MNKRVTRLITLIVLLPIITIFGYLALSQWNEFRIFQQFYTSATETIQVLAKIDDKRGFSDENLDVDEWNRRANKKLNSFYATYDNVKHSEIINSIQYNRTLMQEVFALRLNYADIVQPLNSERMLDSGTIRDKAEYEWRMQTLDNIYQYTLTYQDNLNDAIENFRESIVSSKWGDKYRKHAWQNWGSGIKSRLVKLLPESTKVESDITKYQRFFFHMYKNRGVYYINEKGEIIFSHQRYLKDSIKFLNSMGPKWQKYAVSNVVH